MLTRFGTDRSRAAGDPATAKRCIARPQVRGKPGETPRVAALADPRRLALAQRLYDDSVTSVAEICRTLGVSRSTLYRYVRPRAGTPPAAPGRVAGGVPARGQEH